jgi:hypothetical protein
MALENKAGSFNTHSITSAGDDGPWRTVLDECQKDGSYSSQASGFMQNLGGSSSLPALRSASSSSSSVMSSGGTVSNDSANWWQQSWISLCVHGPEASLCTT